MSAPNCANTVTASTFPMPAAICSGVPPRASFAFSTPSCTNTFTPRAGASIQLVAVFASLSAPSSANTLRTSKCPRYAAK
jgi:hypothetical protein